MPGLEITRSEHSWRQQIDIGAEYPAIEWPTELPHPQDQVVAWQKTLTEAGRQLLQPLALADVLAAEGLQPGTPARACD
ncbi:MAG: hypothetical protein EKK45_18050 [Curvibacter sp.]|nr:MAG: hypothetical protein EKK45_18050 [Curvibacter sp.]